MADALNFVEFDEYVERVEDGFKSVLPKRYVRDFEDPFTYYTDVQFKSRYRFEKETVLAMMRDLHIVERLQRYGWRGLPLPPLTEFMCALRFYSSGNFQTVLGDVRKLHQSTVSRCLHRVSRVIAEQLRNFVKFPDSQGQLANQDRFLNERHFPEVVGVIDATHVAIRNPGKSIGEIYRNKKRYFSLNVQIICGPELEILDLVARWPGSTHDAKMFDNCSARTKFETGQIQGCLIGDTAYPCTPYLLTPLFVTQTAAEERYNKAQKYAHNTIECCIGNFKRRLLCLKRHLAYSPEKVHAFICACAVLYNIGVKMNDPLPEDGDIPDQTVPMQSVAQPEDSPGAKFRHEFIVRHFE